MEIAKIFQIGHDVTDRRGTQIQPGVTRQCARPDRLAVTDITFHQHFQQMLCAIIKIGMRSYNGFLVVIHTDNFPQGETIRIPLKHSKTVQRREQQAKTAARRINKNL